MCGTNRLVGLRLYNKNVALRLVGGGLAPFSMYQQEIHPRIHRMGKVR